MKPANFPGRKNTRRNRALARLQTQPTGGAYRSADEVRRLADALALTLNSNAYAIRTKKVRGVGRPVAARAS